MIFSVTTIDLQLLWWIQYMYVFETFNITQALKLAHVINPRILMKLVRNWSDYLPPWDPSQYPKRRLTVRSSEVSKPRDLYFKLSYRFEIWQAHRQHCCRSACQISERSDFSKYKSRGFETSRDLTIRLIFGYWDGALVPLQIQCCGTNHL